MVKHIILAACLFSSFSIYAWEYPAADNPQTIVDFYSLGLGTPEEPYVITTAQQLANFSYVINSGIDLSGKYVELGNDITLNEPGSTTKKGWTPVGTSENPFKGYFDGKGHSINGLYLSKATVSEMGYGKVATAGLFGYAESATISNTNLADVDIDIKLKTEDYDGVNALYTGCQIGYLKNGNITSCNVSGTISIDIESAGDGYSSLSGCYGGIVGELRDGKSITDCQFDGSISISAPGSQSSIDNGVGGIGGTIHADGIKNLTNNGIIECTDGESHASGIAAGLYTDYDPSGATVTGLFNNGNVSSAKGSTAGIAYWLSCGAIENCHNTGDIRHSGERASSFGITSDAHFMTARNCSNRGSVDGPGLIGYGDFLSLMEDCHNHGDVDGAGLLTEPGVNEISFINCSNHGHAHTGGIMGSTFSVNHVVNMENCHNYGDITGAGGLSAGGCKFVLKSCSNSGNVDGTDYFRDENPMSYYPSYSSKVGGLIGRASEISLEDCENSGNVTGPHISGGLAGDTGYSAKITNCKNSGTVSSIYNDGLPVALNSNPAAGGLTGMAYNSSEITGCRNAGKITVDNKQLWVNHVCAGGLVGEFSGSISASSNTGELSFTIEKLPESNYHFTYAGGLVGRTSKIDVSGCYNTGDVSGNADEASGLIAYKEGYGASNDGSLTDSYSACKVVTDCGIAVGLISLGEDLPIRSCFSYSSLNGNEIYGIGYRGTNVRDDVTDTFYLTADDATNDGSSKTGISASAASADEFASGAICVALNHGRTTDAPWGQKPGTDPYPLLNGAGDPDDIGGIGDIVNDNTDEWDIYSADGIILYQHRSGSVSEVSARLEKGLYILVSRDGKSVKLIK